MKHWNEVVRADLPSIKSRGMQEISSIFEVNGAATEASALLIDTPPSAYFNAPQSFAPSPQNPINGFLGK